MPQKYILLALAIFLSFTLLGQASHCGAHWPSTLQPTPTIKGYPKSEICIPVVVHVVWHDLEDRISVERVQSQIDVLNEDFRALNADLSNILSAYANRYADTEINFALATVDPQGNPSNGIVYRETPNSQIAASFDGLTGRRRLCYDALGGSDAWPPYHYLNIWVAELEGTNANGIGIFPEQVGIDVPAAEDGVYIDTDAFGRVPGLAPPLHLGRTTTHEIGHYLNLFHLWGPVFPDPDCNIFCCEDPAHDDLVDDTALQIRLYQGICPEGNTDNCPQDGVQGDMYQNFMGFSSDDCLIFFTEGQKARMRTALETFRPGLITTNCIVSNVVTPSAKELADITYYPASQELHIRNGAEEASWQIFSIYGQAFHPFQTQRQSEQVISVQHLSAGVYFLVGNTGGYRQVFEWVVVK